MPVNINLYFVFQKEVIKEKSTSSHMMPVISPLAHQKYWIWGKTNGKPL